MLTFVTFLLLCYSAVLCNPHGVFWTIDDKRVTIGHDLNLYCNESLLAEINCCSKHSTRRWFGGPNRELLYRNGISSYPSKYTSRLEDGGFYLTIHNLEVKDLNVSYACSVSIYEYTNILRPPYDIVFWTLVDKRVTIGHDLNLYCNESLLAEINCCPKHSTRRWFGGPNRELLYRNGISSYPSKYTSRLEDGGFYLTIHNVEVKDLNVSYACSVSIYEYTNILRPRYDIVLIQVLPEASMSTEPSITGNAPIGDDKIPYIIIILVIVMGLILVGGTGIVHYHRRRIKKLLMEKFRSCTISEKGEENISMESGEVIEYQIKTENSDQKSFEEEPFIEAATTTENTDQKEIIELDILKLERSISLD